MMFRILSAIFCLVLLAASCSDGLPEVFPAPDFTLKDLLGDAEIRLSDFKGSPVILYFFASW